LHKLYLNPAPRYSEDIDLVQIKVGPIKPRALDQLGKGRDLFDLDYSRLNMELNIEEIIHCFKEYITFATGNRPPSIKEFLINVEEKELDLNFTGDMEALLRPEITDNQGEAFTWLKKEII
jgi:predicted nucleotidyltransferase component of viral defense system